MTESSNPSARFAWVVGTVGFAAILLATWAAQTFRLPHQFTLIPKLAAILPTDARTTVWLVTSAGILFAFMSQKLVRGRFEVTGSMTIALTVLCAFLVIGLVQQWLGVRDQAYRIAWSTTLTSIGVELAVLGFVWSAWFIALRKPGLMSRACLNWLVSFYVVNVWCGGGVWLIGP
jgi:hypothetical protein